MKKREGLRSWMYVILMAVAVMGMSILLSQVPAQAAVDCTTVKSNDLTDTDGDGFTDYQECNGFKLNNGVIFPGKSTINPSTGQPYDRRARLDPDSKDLFVILVRATPSSSHIPWHGTNASDYVGDAAYWFEYVSNIADQIRSPTSTGHCGLGLTVHEITAAQAATDRTVCPTCAKPTGQLVKQRAVKITESLDQTADNILGLTSQCGTPDGLDGTTVYTQKIYNLLNPIGKLGQMDLYIKHTIAHEIGHTVGPLAPVNLGYGLYHYQSADNGLIMDQSVYQSGSNVYVGTQYKDLDQAGIRLK